MTIKNPHVLPEQPLLARLQRNLIGIFLISFLLLDGLTFAVTDTLFRHDLLVHAKQNMSQIWQKQQDDETQEILRDDFSFRRTSDNFITTWDIAASGHIVQSVAYGPGIPFPLKNILPFYAHLKPTHHASFVIIKRGSLQILIGTDPLWHHGRFVGWIQSVYSLGEMQIASRVLGKTSLIVAGIMGVLAVVLAYGLSKRNIMPIKHALQRQRDFVHNASHELRTPLSIIQTSLELAQEDAQGEVKSFIDSSLLEVHYLTRLLTHLQRLAQQDSGILALDYQWFNSASVIEDVINSFRDSLQQAQMTLTSHLTKPLMIYADPTLFKELLIILIDNAIKYGQQGGNQIVVESQATGRSIRIKVSDNGAGIPPALQTRIFERFFRASPQKSHGFGLGLSMAAWIVHMHQAHIHVHSEPYQQTMFVVEFPLPRSGSS
ncbi:sensor histidine kinase [Sulfobacillus thermosulfidooxidans]|uniref:sensor histidine kinase n=1 Tax=Sulfobacillus thermosulfidooxidans TaxID=28034 RepID=UPI0006B5CACE|nr:HAMP domain-containing sensor histidine kinase [Sulfobacillus thermosulfidooxidans]